tara:strand:- start:48 stop:449 length:402 start_codon:yes stop_codon:yes gene_type:complete
MAFLKIHFFMYFVSSKMLGGSLRHAKRVLVSKEYGLEIHYYKDVHTGLEEIIYFESAQVSAVHRWTSKTKDSDGGESTSTNNAIVANSVIHKIPGSKKQIGQLCKILELDLKTASPDFIELQNYNFPERMLFG